MCLASCKHNLKYCVSNTLALCYVQKAGVCEYAVVRDGMGKRIKNLLVQVVVSLLNFVILLWLSLEIYRKHFTGHRSMSLPNASSYVNS